MARGWKTKSGDLEISLGKLIEGAVLDADGYKQGSILIGVKNVGSRAAGELTVDGFFLAASDPSYRWWMEEGDGKKIADAGWYHLCGQGHDVCAKVRGKTRMVHFTKFRVLEESEIAGGEPSWAVKKELQKGYKDRMTTFRGWLKAQGVAVGGAPLKGRKIEKRDDEASDWGEGDEEDPDDEDDESPEDEEAKEEGKKLRARLEKLRRELKDAEDQAEENRKKLKAGKAKKRKGGGANDKGRKKGEAPSGRARSGGRLDKDEKPRKKKRRRKEKTRRSSDSGRTERKKKKKKAKSAASGSSKSYLSDENEDKGEGLFDAKQRGKDQEETLTGDRGPFGEGPPVRYEDHSSSDESDFQKPPSGSAKSSQLKLLAYTRKHPGRLASRMLLKMQTATARGLGGASKSHTPAVAMNHVLTVMLPALQGKVGLRTQRELKTLAEVIDKLALGMPSRAADVLAQRVKALERATVDGGWNTAQFLELLPPESSTLLERDEELHLAKELLMDQKIKGYHRSQGSWQSSWERPQKGKGQGKKGESKGDRTKGKGKKGAQEGKEATP